MNTNQTNGKQASPGLKDTFREDFRQGNYGRAIRQDVADLYNYYVDDERKERLKRMRWLRRSIYTTFWLLQSLILKLTPARRLLLVIAILCTIVSPNFSLGSNEAQSQLNLTGFGFLILLLILALELKDKLAAHHELQAGFAVQSALMPKRSPEVAGWDVWLYTRPAREVGGDMVDYFKLSETRHGVALGDVADSRVEELGIAPKELPR